MSENLKLAAVWTPDCQGKKDYDGTIVKISTRYWPRGGGFFTFNSHNGEFKDNEDRPEIKPSATCSLVIEHGDPEGIEAPITLAELKVKGDTFEEVAAKVEEWAQKMMDRVVAAMRAEFKGDTKDEQ